MERDLEAEHKERRRAFLIRTATTAPAIAILLEQGIKPARAQAYQAAPPVTTNLPIAS